MTKDAIREKIRKVLAHEKSARAIGSTAEADAYASHAKTLLRRHKITKKSLTAKPEPKGELYGRASGSWSCSCGFKVDLEIDAPAQAANYFVRSILGPHLGKGHKLEKNT